MNIITEQGRLLKSFSKYDPNTVPAAYRWIAAAGYRIVRIQCIMGTYYMIVR